MDNTKKQQKQQQRPFRLVIVESPSKCKTIATILHNYVQEQGLDYDFVVTSCMGHIRNLPKTRTHVNQTVPGIEVSSGYQPTYELIPGKEGIIRELQSLSNQAQQLILATDDDREGEAMAWHLLQVLREQQSLPNQFIEDDYPPLRARFNEITPKAIIDSIFHNPNPQLRDSLVQAQETRRILDRLAGFTVSPVLWKKIAPGLSAGRVQSVGMAMIVQRERERLVFQKSEYWELQAEFDSTALSPFSATLISINGQSVASSTNDFEPRQANTLTEASKQKLHLRQDTAKQWQSNLFQSTDWTWTVTNITSTLRKQNPLPNFITSTLQQEASTRLSLSVSHTMQLAQSLYEQGYISYMRTDSNHLSQDAQRSIRTEIIQRYGGVEYYQPKPTASTNNKGKGTKKTRDGNKPEAQAAHEAIRPAIQPNGQFLFPSDLPQTITGPALALYELIYRRTVASQMPPQVSNLTSVRIMGRHVNGQDTVIFKTSGSGSVIVFPGYTIVYPRQSGNDEPTLPKLKEGQRLECTNMTALMHTTQPPARYTEASFVQELEALGVGRPSTYAGTVQILRDRGYVGSPTTNGASSNVPNQRGSAKRAVSGPAIIAQRAAGGEEFTGHRTARGPMVPSLSAFVVTSLLEKHCPTYVDPSFTARMEERLDQIANSEIGNSERITYLDEFYAGPNGLASQIQQIDQNVSPEEARRAKLPALTWNGNSRVFPPRFRQG